MILLDDRTGSIELLPYFKKFGVDVDATRLEFGDACWAGSGPDGDCLIGLERKRISDLVQSMRERRLSGHQLPGLMDTYQFVYLLIEGYYRPGDHGELEERHIRKGKSEWRSMGVSYREVNNHLSTLELKCGVIVRRTSTPTETVAVIVDLYKWWSEKGWDKHKSHHQIYAPSPDSLITSRKARFISPEETIRRRYGDPAVVCWKWAAQLPGLDAKAELIAEHFRIPARMVTAKEKDWTAIKGVGKTLARRFMELIHGE